MHFGAEVSETFRHFGTSEKIWDSLAPNTWCRNKCLGSEVSIHLIEQ